LPQAEKETSVDDKITTIRQQIKFPVKPIEVYHALVNPEQHAEFTEARVTGQPKIGNTFTWLNGYAFGVFLDLEQGKRILLEWQTEKWPTGARPSTLELDFQEIEGGTELTLMQSGVPAGYAEILAEGWLEFYWTPLQRYFERKQSGPPSTG
jgi:activator of HSP90 ATPase